MSELSLKVKDIKQSFRLMMDGKTSTSMREKGLHYHLNWGVSLPMLQEMALTLKKEHEQLAQEYTLYDLAISLWKEDVRECKILATMLMPPLEMLPEVCDIWMEQIPSQEIAEQVAFNTWQHLPYIAEKAYQWISSHQEYYLICGFHVLSRLFMRGMSPNERGINEYLDQALIALQDERLSVRKAALQSLHHFSELGLMHSRLTKSAMKSVNLDFF